MKRFHLFLLLAILGFIMACMPGCAAMHTRKQPTYEMPNSAESSTGDVRPTRWRRMADTMNRGGSVEARKIEDDLNTKF